MSEQLEVGLVDSYARRVEGGVLLVLHLPGAVLPRPEVTLRLRSEGRRRLVPARVSADEAGATVTTTEPRRLGPGAPWDIHVHDGEAWRAVGARVLAPRRPQPVALLVGRPTRSTIRPGSS